MAQYQQVEGYIPVFEVLTRFGCPNPSKAWKKLQLKARDRLPPHTLKQFTMKDGRKGRMTPAIHVQHHDDLVRLLDSVDFTRDLPTFIPEVEHELLKLLCSAFLDQQPTLNVAVGEAVLDLVLERPRVGVVLISRRVSDSRAEHLVQQCKHLEVPFGGVILPVQMQAAAFDAGAVIRALRFLCDPVQQPEKSEHTMPEGH